MKPRISVIITAYNEEDNIRSCLDSLTRQQGNIPFETILVDSSSDRTADIVRKEFPRVLLLTRPERTYCGDARNVAVAHSRAKVIAFLDADCTAAPDWIMQIERAHAGPCEAAGGTIANSEPATLTGWASYFCEFSRYVPGTPPGVIADMAGANLSLKRAILKQYGPFIGGTYASDSAFNARLAEAGVTIRFIPEIRIEHRSISTVRRFLTHEFVHGRAYARVRVSHLNFTRWQKMVYPWVFLLITAKRFLEISLRVVKNRRFLVHFITALPLILAGLTVWSLGESAGYLGKQS
ncbi:glycosyltransferase [bacterium]|nr:glycosyltransferase [bacterium]